MEVMKIWSLKYPLCLFLLGCYAAPVVAATGLRVQDVPFHKYGAPITRNDFYRCFPEDYSDQKQLKKDSGEGFTEPSSDVARDGYWFLMGMGEARLLGSWGRPPDLEYFPELKGIYRVTIGFRGVGSDKRIGIKLSGEDGFRIIDGFAHRPDATFDWEVEWKDAMQMDGKSILLRGESNSPMIRYLCFTPVRTEIRKKQCTSAHITVLKKPGEHFAFPGAARLTNGDLIVVCRHGKEHQDPSGRIVLTRSKDDGKTWSDPECIYDSPDDDRDPAILELPDGRILVSFYTSRGWAELEALRQRYQEQYKLLGEIKAKSSLGPHIIFSGDNGQTWSSPIRQPCFSPHGPIRGPDRTLFWFRGKHEDDRFCYYLTQSHDFGKSWIECGSIAFCDRPGEDISKTVFREPAGVRLADGRWVVAMGLKYGGHIHQCVSHDGGQEWTAPSALQMRGKPPHLLALKDGRLLMAYGHRVFPFGIRVCLSQERGDTWDVQNEIVLRYEGADTDLGYPVSLQLDDGRVFVVYYYNDNENGCYIEASVFQP